MASDRDDRAEPQQQHWDTTYAAHPAMYGEEPSAPAVYAAQVFRDAGAHDVVELGAGHGRDALFSPARVSLCTRWTSAPAVYGS